MKWANFSWTKITGGESFVFFYDEDKLRICTQKEGAQAYSTGTCLSNFDRLGANAFRVDNDKSSLAKIKNSSEYNFPAETDMNKQGESLFISGSGKRDFTSEIFEVYGIDF